MNDPPEDVRILCVDDDAGIRELVAEMLERQRAHFQVVTADSGASGLKRLAAGGIDCIVSDFDMPGMDGLAFLEAVRETSPDVPFVLFTGKGSEEIASEAISRGVSEYMQKGRGTDQYVVLANRIENLVAQARAEDETRLVRKRLEAIVDANPDFVFLFTPDGEYEEILAGASEITTYPSETFLDRPVEDFWPEEAAATLHEAIQTTIATGEGQRIEYRLPIGGHAGRERRTAWYEGRTALVEFDRREQPRVMLTAREVTDRKLQELQLRTFRKAVEHAGHQIYWTAPDGTIEYVNPAFEATTGYSAAEAIGNTPRILKSGEHDRAFYDDLWGTITAGEIWRNEVVNETKSGERYVVDQTIAPVYGESGEIEHFVAVNVDITEQFEPELELEG